MRAMVMQGVGAPLIGVDRPMPEPVAHEVLIAVQACGVCRTDLHIVDGDLPLVRASLVPGHEIVGTVVANGADAHRFAIGERIGVPWLGGTCGHCGYCADGHENLCDAAVFTGYQRDGGYAEYTLADERYCLRIPGRYDAAHAAPLLCAGLIGHRAYAMAEVKAGERLGLYGFGAAAHIVAQVAVAHGSSVHAFTRPGDTAAQAFARELGASWARDSTLAPDVALDAALIFAPVGSLVPAALKAVRKGGRVVCAGIHMSDIPAFPYAWLWGERSIRSVANLTRADGEAFMTLAGQIALQTHPVIYPLEAANTALTDLREGRLNGAAVLVPARQHV